jgi:hypothetical protein
MADGPIIQAGTCHALYAYEVAYAIDLEAAERLLTASTERQTIKQKRRAPPSFEYRPAPVRVALPAEPVQVGTWATAPGIEIVLHDFGAVSVSYAIDIAGPLSVLPALSAELYGNERLLADSRRQVERLVTTLRESAARPRIADFVEDYAIFEIEACAGPCEPSALWTHHAALVAQILRAEPVALSQQEIQDATGSHLSFGADDVTFIDTDAALLYDKEADDVLAVIELANTQLLEMRYLDQRFDAALDRAYEMLSRQRGRSLRFGLLQRDLPNVRRLAELQLDSAILFEQVTNALKLIGDQYLVRVYGLVSRRFQLAAWDQTISRKLQAIESIYTKMVDRAATRRMEALEWIIIVLIAVSIILPFLGLGAK